MGKCRYSVPMPTPASRAIFRSVAHLEENLAAGAVALDAETMATLRA